MKLRHHRFAFSVLAVVIAGVWLAQLPAAAQSQAAAPKTYTAKTPWGHPDLMGTWTAWDRTPLQAPDPGKVIPPSGVNEDDGRRPTFKYQGQEYEYAGLGSGMGREHESPISARRRSLVSDPENGRLPLKVTPREPSDQELFDDYLNHSAWTRCISMGVPGRLLSAAGGGYNKAYDIFQSPGHVVIYHEMLHEARVIPLDGGPHVGPDVKMWMGDSRGRWEGQTLVVETTNFNGKGDGQPRGVKQTQALKVVERFTRVDDKTLQYEVTLTDPNVYTRPWTAMQFHNLDPKYTIYEYACHEGNMRYMTTVLSRGRLLEAQGAPPATGRAR